MKVKKQEREKMCEKRQNCLWKCRLHRFVQRCRRFCSSSEKKHFDGYLQKKEDLLKVLSCRCILHASAHLHRSFFFFKYLNQPPSPLGKGKEIDISMALAQCCDALATTHQKTNTGSTEYLKKKKKE